MISHICKRLLGLQVKTAMASEEMPNPWLPMTFCGKSCVDSPKNPDFNRKSHVDRNLVGFSTIYHTWSSLITC